MNELKELLIKAFNLELDDSQDAEPNTYLFNYEYDVTDALNTAMQLIESFTTRRELEAKIESLVVAREVHKRSETNFISYLDNNINEYKSNITQLSTELSNKEMK